MNIKFKHYVNKFKLTYNLWEKTILTANYIVINLPYCDKDETSSKSWKSQKPTYRYLKI